MERHASKKRKTDSSRDSGPVVTDSRFANIQSDPRFRLPGKRQRIKVDKRFAKALHDEDFSRKAKVDRYGRPLETDSEKKRLKRKYEFEEDQAGSEESDAADDDNEVQAELKRVDKSEPRDVLREGRDVSSSEEDSSSEEESDQEEEEVDTAGPGVQDRDVPMGEVSSRLAVVNLDWDNIRAEDLMAVFQSFLPASGRLLSVAVYPSEFGRERMEREELEGPPKEIFASNEQANASESESESEDDEEIKNAIIKPDDGSEFDTTALRQYQLDRLRYFFAILTFSSPQTAKVIYDAVDGTEYLSTANFFDLRFVPDETEFSNDEPREQCERIPSGYKPNEFVTDALQHSKVKLTWDAEDASRKEAQARAFRGGRRDIDEDDLRAYLGSSSESEDEVDEVDEVAADKALQTTGTLSKKEAERQRMRALLGLAPEPVKTSKKDKKDVHMGNIQITFSSGLSGIAHAADDATESKAKRSVFENSPEPNETTMEKYIRKEKERKQRRKEKMKGSRDGVNAKVDTHTQSGEDAGPDETTDLGFNDPFFAEPSLDAKNANKQRKAERLKRRQEREADEAASAHQRAELEKVMAAIDADKSTRTSDKDTGTTTKRTVKHFDMNEIEKAEKAQSKKNKNKKLSNKSKSGSTATGVVDHETVLANDDFKIDAADPRFARLYENHEFAIDPTNPRFKGTKGMKTLLEEGRKRKGKGEDVAGGGRKPDGTHAVKPDGSNEVMGLVEKIKRRQK